MAQIPQPCEPGIYRVYEPAEFEPRRLPNQEEIQKIVHSGMHEVDTAFLFHALDTSKLNAVGDFVPANAIPKIWGIVAGTTGD